MEKKRSVGVILDGLLIIIVFFIGFHFWLSFVNYILRGKGLVIKGYLPFITRAVEEQPIQSIVIILLSLSGLIGGIGVILLKKWARILVLCLAPILLIWGIISFNIIGIIFSLHILYYYTRPKVKRAFGERNPERGEAQSKEAV